MAKAEYPPLFQRGFHVRGMAELREQCVAAFPLSTTRAKLMAALDNAVQRLVNARLWCEVWVDGSFLTQKIDPSDVDVAVIVPEHIRTSASAEIREVLEWIESDDTYDRERLDGYVLTQHPDNSPMAPIWQSTKAKFEKLFGTRYDDVTPKGIVVIPLRGV